MGLEWGVLQVLTWFNDGKKDTKCGFLGSPTTISPSFHKGRTLPGRICSIVPSTLPWMIGNALLSDRTVGDGTSSAQLSTAVRTMSSFSDSADSSMMDIGSSIH